MKRVAGWLFTNPEWFMAGVFVFYLLVWGTVVTVAAHFIAKYW